MLLFSNSVNNSWFFLLLIALLLPLLLPCRSPSLPGLLLGERHSFTPEQHINWTSWITICIMVGKYTDSENKFEANLASGGPPQPAFLSEAAISKTRVQRVMGKVNTGRWFWGRSHLSQNCLFFYFKAHTVSMFLLKAACTPTVATALRAAAKREVGENGKKTQETAAIERRLL